MLLPLLMALGSRIPVLHYSDRFVAVNKPAGISVHRNKDTGRRRVVTTQLQRQFRRKVFPAHRLDHRTSGALLFGFDGPTAGKAHDALAAGTKEYLCLLRGGDWPGEGGADVVVEKPVKGDDGATRGPCSAASRRRGSRAARCASRRRRRGGRTRSAGTRSTCRCRSSATPSTATPG